MHTLAILLSVFNGKKYLQAQLDSIITQTIQCWHLFIRDDGSKDDSVQIIIENCKKNPEKITFLKDELGNIGVIKSFETLLNQVSAKNYLFCDQDDIWFPERLLFFSRYFSQNNDFPTLVFCDYTITDTNLQVIKKKSFENKISDKWDILFKNTRPGCTMMINDSLRSIALPFPECIFMHDHWFYQIALYFGRVYHIEKRLQYYRQHESNLIGIKKKSLSSKILKYIKPKEIEYLYQRLIKRNDEILDRFKLQKKYKTNIEEIVSLNTFLLGRSLLIKNMPLIKYLSNINVYLIVIYIQIFKKKH